METNPNHWIEIASVITSAIAAAGVCWIAWRTFRRGSHDKIASEERWKGEVDADRANFKEFMREIRRDIRRIFEALNQLGTKSDFRDPGLSSIIKPGSPLRLTDLGQSISIGLNAPAWAAKAAELTKDKVMGLDAYAIQEFSFDYADDKQHYSEEETQAIRERAYENGLTEYLVRRVMGIELRDVLLKIVSLAGP